MKKMIAKIFGFDKDLESAFNRGYQRSQLDQSEKKEQEEIRRLELNHPVGQRVMVVGNSGPMRVATIKSYENFGNHLTPILVDEKTQEEFCTMGELIPFNSERYRVLSTLPWWDAWNVVTKWCSALTAEEGRNIEANRPAWDNGDGTTVRDV